VSEAVPVATTSVPLATLLPLAGEVMVVVGPVLSVDLVAATSPAIKLTGCAPMSAKRLTWACCILTSGAAPLPSCPWSSPHDHWIDPAEKTSAPLDARYIVMWCVVAPGATRVPKS
jgi:hypothetical protein